MITAQQQFAINTLARCTFPVGSGQKRFIRNLKFCVDHQSATKPLTPKQELYLANLFFSYRRQHKLLPIIEW